MLIEFQRALMEDRVRNEAFYAALKATIVPGQSVVVDLGSGTGFLGFLAAKLGAKAVYLIEYTDIIKVSQKLAQKNKIKNCHFIHAHSSDIEKDFRADVLISETLGNYAYEENIIESLHDAKRFLKPGGVVIPQGVQQLVAPVTTNRFHQELIIWDDIGYGLDFSLAKEITLNNLYVRTITPQDLLDNGKTARRWDKVDFARNNASVRKGTGQWKIESPQTVYGFAVWWECKLFGDIHISTDPAHAKTHWEQLYLPVQTPIDISAGDTITVALNSDSRLEVGVYVDWKVTHTRADGSEEVQAMSMRKGFIG